MASFPVMPQSQFPADPGQTIAETAAAWESFIRDGQFPKHKPRQIIANSWQQCRETGIDPDAKRAPTVLSFEYLKAFMQEHELGQAGGEVLDSFSDLMAGSEHVLVLADAKGQMLHSVGQNQIQKKMEKINFMPGAAWSEATVGPNGIGTTLSLGRPELVLGSEHYCQGWQPWVCYGAPIYAPGNDRLIGAVDITGPARCVKNENLALTISIAKSIEQFLMIKHMKVREQRQEIVENMECRWPHEGLLLLHADGDFLDLNRRASRLLNLDIRNSTKNNLAQKFPQLWRNLQPALSRTEGFNDFVFSANGQIELDCRIEPFSIRGRDAGWVLVLHEKRSQPKRKIPDKRYFTFEDIKGTSIQLQKALRLAQAAAQDLLKNPVLIQGETGTGKELVAQAIHTGSAQGQGPFIAINCGALPADLVESELFGYEGGAFTGARRQGMPGKFEAANGGTLFLDEIDSMPMHVQVKLLRVIEESTVTRIGSHQACPVDCRIITASGKNLRQQTEAGEFRLDLYHRISILEIELPALRDREQDIKLLTQFFIDQACRSTGREPLSLSKEVEQSLREYHWPGNLRELHNLCHRWVMTIDGTDITLDDVPDHLRQNQNPDNNRKESLKNLGNDLIEKTLQDVGGNVSRAADKLGIARSTLYRRLKK